ncbi:palindromic element RPE4 domain-containing protein [Rickettsia endosymbiont of Urophora cardui]|uniref:palindromic element RPE4 domain-containing protein n=1 Tax=Rickettsia endosymbiont of Urophora cardui TaxID=3066265 RepID=UPI00313E260A
MVHEIYTIDETEPRFVIPATVHGCHPVAALLRGLFSLVIPPVIYSRDPVKNTNKISIFNYFLDTVDKPRYDTDHVSRFILDFVVKQLDDRGKIDSPRQHLFAMTCL